MAMIYGDGYGQIAQLEAQRNAANAANFWAAINAQRQAEALDEAARVNRAQNALSWASLRSREDEAADSRALQYAGLQENARARQASAADARAMHNDARAMDLMKVLQANRQFQKLYDERQKQEQDARNWQRYSMARRDQEAGYVPPGKEDEMAASLGLPEEYRSMLRQSGSRMGELEAEANKAAEAEANSLNAMIKSQGLEEAKTLLLGSQKQAHPEGFSTPWWAERGSVWGLAEAPLPEKYQQWIGNMANVQAGRAPSGMQLPKTFGLTKDLINRWERDAKLRQLVQYVGTDPFAPFAPVPRVRYFGNPTAPNVGGGVPLRPLPRELAIEFFNKAGGDPNTARFLAQEAGYTF